MPYIFFFSFLPETNMFILLYFAVHYAPGPSNTFFGSVKGIDGNIHFQFVGQASLFSEGSTSERNVLISGGDERTLKTIMSTTFFKGENRAILRKPDFLFEDAALDTDQQLLAAKVQWIYTLDGDRYYLPESKRHYPLAFFHSVTVPRLMR